MKKILPFLALIPCLLCANASSVSSKKASFDGNALVLKGTVEVSHSLGQMCSEFARLEKESKDGPYASIALKKNVLIALKGRGKISCNTAELDFQSLRGILLPKKGEYISFEGNDLHPFVLSSPSAELEFSREGKDVEVTKVIAAAPVNIRYSDNFSLDATAATYFTENGTSHKVQLQDPKGTLHSSAFASEDGLKFTCNELVWNQESNTIQLQGDVDVTDSEFGHITCSDQVQFDHAHDGDNWRLSDVYTRGTTSITFRFDPTSIHRLVCNGRMHLDEKQLLLSMESDEEAPLDYSWETMRLAARSAKLHYAQNNGSLTPKKILLRGNIALSTATRENQCAIADNFVMLPDEETMILSADSGKKVLFWDNDKKLSISADTVHIHRTERGEEVKGVGSVCFAFTSAENQILKKLFPFYKPHRRSR